MTVEFVELAEIELDEAIHYYESEVAGLGVEFEMEVASTVNRIVEFPDAWQQLEFGVRRCRLHRFPYGIAYLQHAGGIVVLAVTHLHIKAQSWQARLRP